MSTDGPLRVLVTGSTEGLGLATARALAERGHRVVLHARSAARAVDARAALPAAEAVLVADAMRLAEVRRLAEDATALGPIDVVVHNMGIGYREPRRIETEDGHAHVLQVNVLAPYLLTALLPQARRLVWLSSMLHRQGKPDLDDVEWLTRPWDGRAAYSESKLLDAALSAAVATRWPRVSSNAVEPGWVPTRMGGPGAPDDLAQAHLTQVWLAEGREVGAEGSGGYLYHRAPTATHPAVQDQRYQERVLTLCAELTGVELPAS